MPNGKEAQPSPYFNLQHEKRTVKGYTLTEDEIDSIDTLDLLGTISLSVATTFVGAAITLLLTLGIDEEPNPYAWGILIVLGVASIFPAGLFVWSVRHSRRKKRQIKQRQDLTGGKLEPFYGGKVRAFYGGGKLEPLSGPPEAE